MIHFDRDFQVISILEMSDSVLESSVYEVKSFYNFFTLEITLSFSEIINFLGNSNFLTVRVSIKPFERSSFNSFIKFFISF